MRRRFACVLTALLMATAVAAVFGAPAGAGEQLTKAAFRKQANDLCRLGNVAIGQVFNDTFEGVAAGEELPPDLIAIAADGAVPILRDMLEIGRAHV